MSYAKLPNYGSVPLFSPYPHDQGKSLYRSACNSSRTHMGKGVVRATPSPLPRGGQFPLFTDVPVSGIGRLRPEYPFRGIVCFDLSRLRIEIL